MLWFAHSKRFGMCYRDDLRVRDSQFVIGSITGDVMKVSIGERGMEDIKGAVSGVDEECLKISSFINWLRMKWRLG